MNKQITIVCGCVVQNGKILMALRNEPECPDAHLKWELSGGKVDFGENAEEAVKREILEETGVKIRIVKLLPKIQVAYWKYKWGLQQTLCLGYFCTVIKERPIPKDHHILKVEWFTFNDAFKLDCLPTVKDLLLLVQKEL